MPLKIKHFQHKIGRGTWIFLMDRGETPFGWERNKLFSGDSGLSLRFQGKNRNWRCFFERKSPAKSEAFFKKASKIVK